MPAREIAALYNSPKPRQEWVDGQFIQNSEDEEAWVELFIDLVYVVLLSKIGDLMETCMHEDPFYGFKLAVIFAVMCLARQSIDEYANRFYSHDLAHKLIYLVYTLGIFIQVSGSAGTKVMCKVS
jgi:low temperature requirement protein LtrA